MCSEYLSLFFLLHVLILEYLISYCLFAHDTVQKVINYLYIKARDATRSVVNSQFSFSSYYKFHPHFTAKDLIKDFGYQIEEYFTESQDGFKLALQRIVDPECQSLKTSKPVVLLMHGLMMCSDVFLIDPKISLVTYFVKEGYDVWLGNNRGNKYSCAHKYYNREDVKYWNFTLDHQALDDIPCFINFILKETQKDSLIYVGFSNGSAIMLAALATYPDLNKKVELFIAISPACKIAVLNRRTEKFPLLFPLLSHSPQFFYFLFGEKQLLKIAETCRERLPTVFFCKLIEGALRYLFSWSTHSATPYVKQKFFFYLYSSTSTKLMNHWLQLYSRRQFESYKDNQKGHSNTVVPLTYDIRQITTFVALVVGTNDFLTDQKWLHDTISNCIQVNLAGYEHLDCLISADIPEKLFRSLDVILKKKP